MAFPYFKKQDRLFFISRNLLNFVENCNIHYGLKSDHSAISLTVLRNVPQRGPGY